MFAVRQHDGVSNSVDLSETMPSLHRLGLCLAADLHPLNAAVINLRNLDGHRANLYRLPDLRHLLTSPTLVRKSGKISADNHECLKLGKEKIKTQTLTKTTDTEI